MKPTECNHLKEELDIIEQISTSMQEHFLKEINDAKFHSPISNHLVFHIVEHLAFSLLSVIAASAYMQSNNQDDIGGLADSFTASVQGNKERFIKNVLDGVKEARNEDTNIN